MPIEDYETVCDTPISSKTGESTISENIYDRYRSMPWLVRVGWLKGRINRDLMLTWCMDHIDSTEFAWDKGGNWWFLNREDAVSFFMVHG